MEFHGFPSLTRFSQDWTVTEKIDGTNGQIAFTEDGDMFVGSRNRWLSEKEDNAGFYRWAKGNEDELRKLGPGRHYGEWYGSGIQRTYGLIEKRFALFNVFRWSDDALRPACCEIVPVFFVNKYLDNHVETFNEILADLELNGSRINGFDKPEGIVCFHGRSNTGFKKTFDYDEFGKWAENHAIGEHSEENK